MAKQKYLLPVLALLTANVLWGLNTIFIKIGLQTIPPTFYAGARFFIAGLCLLPFALKTWKPLNKKEILHFILVSIVTITLSAFSLNLGLSMAPAQNAAVIWLLCPIALLLLSATFLREKISLKIFCGIVVAILGSFVVLSGVGQGSTSATALTGNLFIMLSVLFQAIAITMSKPLMKKANTYQATFLIIFPGSIPVAVYALSTLNTVNFMQISQASALAFVVSTVTILLANVLFYYALSRKSANATGVYTYVSNVVTVLAAWYILHERPGSGFVLGAVLIITGIILAERHTTSSRHHHRIGG